MASPLEAVVVAFGAVPDDSLPMDSVLVAADSLTALYDVMFPGGGRIPNLLKNDHSGHVVAVRRIASEAAAFRGNASAAGSTTVDALIVGEIQARGVEGLRNNWSTGTLNLLWIGRTAHFICVFLEQLSATEHAPHSCARTAYSESLAPFHTWVVAIALRVALGLVPSRSELHASFGLLPPDDATSHAQLRRTAAEMRRVTDRLLHVMKANGVWFDDKLGL